MPAVASKLRRERAARLREAGAANAARFYAGLLGREISVLAESASMGHSEHFAPVRIAAAPGQVRRALGGAANDSCLLAEPA